MKKFFNVLLFGLIVFSLSACETGHREPAASGLETSSETGTSSFERPEAAEASAEQAPAASEEQEDLQNAGRRISVQFGENAVIYELNDGTAATSLYEQLPLTIDVENYSTNEKIFYPPEELDITDSPLARSGAGTLAYYAPWGDVVMFYGDYRENFSLYELGQAVSGGELISEMSGTVTVTAVE